MARREEEILNRNIDTNSTLREDDQMIGRTRDQEASIPVVEEELAVGKRTVETGGVRVHKEVTETPVHETVSLHEEHVTVERRPVNREVQPGDMHAFENSTIEMREMSEEAVVEKRARVVEEVVVGKEARERTEQITDTVRRSDVKVEPIVDLNRTTSSSSSMRTFDTIEGSCRTHYNQNFANSGWDYDSGYSHAYRYGYDLAGSGGDWSTVETDVQSKWEMRNKGTWERFKDAIRYGYDQGRQ
ncbi:MAG TPA: YsnF/AvaK domain-containing protein [Thermoanaerobaculia bacterium]|nr:YsnF/AvaK domain-containing protein [Thermoanaerobaculia bacterium]